MKPALPETTRTDLVLGMVIAATALLIAFVWIPLDVDSGLFEKVRRRVQIGDAFAPTIAAGLLGLGGLLLMIEAVRSPGVTRLSRRSVFYAVGLLALFAITFTVMRFAGPMAVWLFGGEGETYRPLRDTAPWKHIGFFLGGTLLVTTVIAVIERRFSWQALSIGIGAALALIAVYDLPFDNLVLPPNGDV